MGRAAERATGPGAPGGGRARRAVAAVLRPTPYLTTLGQLLEAEEPELWAFFSGAPAQTELLDEARQDLLRTGYRLDGAEHEELAETARLAARRVGVSDPVTLYQAEDGGSRGANAQVVSLPGEAHIVFSGRMLELLEGLELAAVLGHELAHHQLLWSDGSAHWVLDRMVGAAAGDLSAAPSHQETARLVRLHTELVADRGGLAAVDGDLPVAVAALVKIVTGLASVSGAAYLNQAHEVMAMGPSRSAGLSHPETFLRAWALERWAEGGDEVEAEIAERLAGPVDLDSLDLLGQRSTSLAVTSLIRRFLTYPWAATDAVVGHARLFDPSLGQPERPAPPGDRSPALEPAPEGLADLFSYVLLDLATVDEDIATPGLAAAMVLSDELGVARRFDTLAAKELGMPANVVKRQRLAASEVLTAAATG